jgi:uncharacterized membrane protein
MDRKSALRWLIDELPNFEGLGLIDAKVKNNLEIYCDSELQQVCAGGKLLKYFTLILSIIGSVLIAGGIILIFNYNWDMFSKSVRITIAFLPLMLALGLGIFTLMRNLPRAWREASAILTAAGIAVLIALLSQIYHTGGELYQFMTIVLYLSLPLIYIFNSFGLSALYGFGLFMTIPGFYFEQSRWNCLILLLLALPYLGYYLYKESMFTVKARYLALMYGAFIMVCFYRYNSAAVLFATAILFFYGGIRLKQRGESLPRNPWLQSAYLLLLILLAIGSSTRYFWGVERFPSNQPYTDWSHWIVYAMLNGAVLLMFIDDWRGKTVEAVRVSLLLWLVVVGLSAFGLWREAMVVLTNIYMGTLGAFLLARALRVKDLVTFNSGLMLCAVLIACRFFDSNIGILERALGFIILGIGCIAANLFFSRRLKLEVKNDQE